MWQRPPAFGAMPMPYVCSSSFEGYITLFLQRLHQSRLYVRIESNGPIFCSGFSIDERHYMLSNFVPLFLIFVQLRIVFVATSIQNIFPSQTEVLMLSLFLPLTFCSSFLCTFF
ncbi:unnamed protein product [Ilex paraguariensis]|uniref:Uncharacterized protein n=1 Tax=Ilex paraguariensis TaxID=185542 RepID=A0ABC8UBT5_9AQUA